jgi:uncharacterized protein
MSDLKPINIRAFRRKAKQSSRSFRRFLTKMEKKPARQWKDAVVKMEPLVWQEVDCLGCANCCKTMTPTFTTTDIKRISAHFGQTPDEFKQKWLYKDRVGDWLNKKEPCQFLDLTSNKCSIYAIRPADCAGFPHLQKNLTEYGHVHKQNIECCPATFRMVERMVKNAEG